MLQEEIRKGQRVERFKVEGLIGNEWRTLAEGTTIGYKRLVKFDDCAPSRASYYHCRYERQSPYSCRRCISGTPNQGTIRRFEAKRSVEGEVEHQGSILWWLIWAITTPSTDSPTILMKRKRRFSTTFSALVVTERAGRS